MSKKKLSKTTWKASMTISPAPIWGTKTSTHCSFWWNL